MTIRPKNLLLVCIAAWLACQAAFVTAESSDSRYLAGLRQRQLYRLAEAYCVQKLAADGLTIEQQADFVVELSRTLAEQAWQASPTDAEPLWKRAIETPAEFARDNTAAPGGLLARVQAALVLLARGEMLRQQAELQDHDQQRLAEARGYLRTALRELTTCSQQTADMLRALGNSSRDKPGSFSRGELLALQTNLRYQSARGYRNQAQCYAADTPDRQNALALATESLQPLTELDAEDSLYWLSRLEVVACLRQSRDFEEAAERLTALTAAGPPDNIRRLAAAERILLALDQRRVDDALRLADKLPPVDSAASPELACAGLEARLAAWRLAAEKEDKAAAKRWEELSAASVENIQRAHGPYWTRRAESLLAGVVASSGGSGNLSLLVRAAEADYRAGRIDAALAGYDRARQQAEQSQPGEAFKLGYTAASIEHERQNHAAAAMRYRDLALAAPQQPRAAEAHLLAIFNAGQAAKAAAGSDTETGASLTEYVALLDEHLQHWPDGPSAAQALMLRGKFEERRGNWETAVAAYQRVPTSQEQFSAAVEAAARCYEKWVLQLGADRSAVQKTASAGALWFEGLVLGAENRWPQRWGATDRTAALAAARLWMAVGGRENARAEKLLTEALAGSTDEEGDDVAADDVAAWRATARCPLVAALARQGNLADARRAVDQMEQVSPAALQQLLDELSALTNALPKQQHKELAELQGRIARLAAGRDGPVNESVQRAIDLAQARSLASAGRTAEAIEAFAALAKEHPREGQIQEEYALALSTAKDRKTLELAQEKWQEVERKSRPGGDRWMRARYRLAVVSYRLGDSRRAATIITSTQKLYPTLGDADLKAKFLELLKVVEK